MPSTTANWHWKNKNVTRWAKEWFERELTSITIKGEKDGESVTISEIKEVDGDVELGQRKSKSVYAWLPMEEMLIDEDARLITIFDCKIDIAWEGVASDGTEVKGRVVVPEVSHEITVDRLSDYVVCGSSIKPRVYSKKKQYDWTLDTTSSSPVDAIYALAKSKLPTALEVKFAEFASAIIDTHGKDLTVSTEPSRSATPVGTTAASAANSTPSTSTTTPPVPAKPAKKAEQKKSLSTVPVTVEADFMAAASDLFKTFTDEKELCRWAGQDAQVCFRYPYCRPALIFRTFVFVDQ